MSRFSILFNCANAHFLYLCYMNFGLLGTIIATLPISNFYCYLHQSGHGAPHTTNTSSSLHLCGLRLTAACALNLANQTRWVWQLQKAHTHAHTHTHSRQMKQSHEQVHWGVCGVVGQLNRAVSWRAKKERTRRNRATKTLEFFSASTLPFHFFFASTHTPKNKHNSTGCVFLCCLSSSWVNR